MLDLRDAVPAAERLTGAAQAGYAQRLLAQRPLTTRLAQPSTRTAQPLRTREAAIAAIAGAARVSPRAAWGAQHVCAAEEAVVALVTLAARQSRGSTGSARAVEAEPESRLTRIAAPRAVVGGPEGRADAAAIHLLRSALADTLSAFPRRITRGVAAAAMHGIRRRVDAVARAPLRGAWTTSVGPGTIAGTSDQREPQSKEKDG